MMKKTVCLRKAAALVLALLMIMSQPLSALAAYKTLEYGAKGTAVLEMQKALLSLGFDPNGTDGKFGSGTRAAVKAYQQARGLMVDGKAGNVTLSLLYSEVNGSSGSSGSTTSTSTSTLKFGSTGSRVTELQTNLKKLGFYSGTVDGKFGAGTQRAVIAFQSANKLTPDGLAGTQTLALLKKLAASSSSSGGSSSGSSSTTSGLNRTLRRGYTGDDVVRVQTRLTELGYYTKTVDGVYGLGSMAAVKEFQERNGLTADGLAGQATFAKLFSSSAIAAGSSSSSGSTGSGSTGSGSTGDTGSSGSTVTYPRLETGDKGNDVLMMQTALIKLNYPLEANGTFDLATLDAVMLFQSINGLDTDGVAGNATLSLLYSGKAKAYSATSSSYPRLTIGATGEDVRQMQTALKKLNYPVSVDGDFGSNTLAAVKLFQGVNGLSADGIAGSSTLALLYGGSAKPYTGTSSTPGSSSGTVSSNAGASAMGSFIGTNGKKIQLLHWVNEIKPSLKTTQNITVFDPATSITFTLYVMSRGRHCDVEPLTAADTAKMMNAWGGVVTWTPKPVYIGLPDGRWTIATMHNVAHGSQVLGGNNFDGQNCVHFLRDMSECILHDPDYGVSNQNALRKAWKNWAGVTVE